MYDEIKERRMELKKGKSFERPEASGSKEV
jgi:hypothetical protein